MANRIKIEILSQPSAFSSFNMIASSDTLAYFSQIFRTFVPGVPANTSAVQIGGDLPVTVQRFYDNLVASATGLQCFFTLASGIIYMNFYEDSDLEVDYTELSWLSVEIDSEIPGPAPVLDPIEIQGFQIEIIDTYENERILIEELASLGSLKLVYDGGDDIFEPFMNSELQFSMLVLDQADAKFYHLFTGDENRYLVKLSNVTDEETLQLIWQGFLLPDQYSEPYKNGVIPVSFTAIDMISTLKGKKLDPWKYYQKYTLPELFSMIMAITGLEQDFIVKTTLENSSPSVGWRNIIVNLEPYINNGKYEDVYKVLEDILVSQCMTLKSYRGYWMLDGFTRKGEISGTALRFDSMATSFSFSEIARPQIAPRLSRDTAVLSAVTPFKSVEVEFDYDEDKNLFPDDVLFRKADFLGYLTDAYVDSTPATTFFRQWNKTGASFLEFFDAQREFSFRRTLPLNPTSYPITEAQSLSNYFECPVKPFLSTNRVYQLELEIEANLYFGLGFTQQAVEGYLDEGVYDKIPVFQMLLNGSEIRSNRPSSSTLAQNTYDERSWKSQVVNPPGNLGSISHLVSFKITREFTVGEDGYLSFRMLAPITFSQMLNFGLRHFEVFPKTLKVDVVEGPEDENTTAVRDINFTETKNVDLPITCSVNASILNGFSLGARAGEREMILPVGTQATRFFSQDFPPLNFLVMTTRRFPITAALSDLIFNRNRSKSMFLEKASGEKKHFFSVYSRGIEVVNVPYMVTRFLYYLTDWTGRPFKPKDYVRLPEIESGDVLKMALSDFIGEDYAVREFWHIHGLEEWSETYPKTVANAYHSVRKDPLFNLETTMLALMLPDQILSFYFKGAERKFIPTRLELDLCAGKTSANLKEATLSQITDITYE